MPKASVKINALSIFTLFRPFRFKPIYLHGVYLRLSPHPRGLELFDNLLCFVQHDVRGICQFVSHIPCNFTLVKLAFI